MKRVIYRCPACKSEIERITNLASRRRESYCSVKGRSVMMRRLRWTRI